MINIIRNETLQKVMGSEERPDILRITTGYSENNDRLFAIPESNIPQTNDPLFAADNDPVFKLCRVFTGITTRYSRE